MPFKIIKIIIVYKSMITDVVLYMNMIPLPPIAYG